MTSDATAKTYAKALDSIAEDAKINIVDEMTKFNELINNANDLENVLFMEIFTTEEKEFIVGEVFKKENYSSIFMNFIYYLINEKRINLLPFIYKDLIVLDDHKKGFIKGTVEGSTSELSDNYLNSIKKYLKSKISNDVELEYIVNNKVSAGYRVTVDDMQLDLTLDNQLNNLRKEL